MYDLSVVILTFNSAVFIKSCLDSLFRQDYRGYEIIIVDNGSSDSTINIINEGYPGGALLIRNDRNFGASKARNQGISCANGKWVLTLDSDVVLEDNFLSNTMGFIQNIDGDIGIVQPKILKNDKKTIYSYGIYLSVLRRFYDIGKGRSAGSEFNESCYVFGACCAAAFYKLEMLEQIKEAAEKYFDERYFFIAEDVDLAWRAQRNGWKAMLYPGALCYHDGNSSNCDFRERQYLSLRNRYYLILKNEGAANYIKKIIPLLFYDFPRLCYLFFANPYIRKNVLRKLYISFSRFKYNNAAI